MRDEKERAFNTGDGWLPFLAFEAGEEIEILVEFNFNKKGITRDWSVTAWGEEGEVEVRHSKGIESKHFSYTPKGKMNMDMP